jgi:Co/Zn/Cd efflux system component
VSFQVPSFLPRIFPPSPTSSTLYFFAFLGRYFAMKNTTKIGIILIISTAFFAAEIAGAMLAFFTLIDTDDHPYVVGFKTKSLALIADAVREASLISENTMY